MQPRYRNATATLPPRYRHATATQQLLRSHTAVTQQPYSSHTAAAPLQRLALGLFYPVVVPMSACA